MRAMLLLILTLLFSTPGFAGPNPLFYSPETYETEVQFDAHYRTHEKNLAFVKNWNSSKKSDFENQFIRKSLIYVFGPLNTRSWGGTRLNFSLSVDWSNATLVNGQVMLPYHYRGTWVIRKDLLNTPEIKFPVPLNSEDVFLGNWQGCYDPNESYQSSDLLWYYWDPERPTCNQTEGLQFQLVKLNFNVAPSTQESRPEYSRMIRIENGIKVLRLTFAFGYFDEPSNPDPENDLDPGAGEYRKFKWNVHNFTSFTETPIYDREYDGTKNRIIGTRFETTQDDIHIIIQAILTADVSPKAVLLKSIAQNHDAFFEWSGHSQVGAAFQVNELRELINKNPKKYSITTDYQIIYWGGCSGYSYYTDPFFELKGGTKNLDIISNSLQNWFSLNADEAWISFKTLMNFKNHPTYQSWTTSLENTAKSQGRSILINVLGDEDNVE